MLHCALNILDTGFIKTTQNKFLIKVGVLVFFPMLLLLVIIDYLLARCFFICLWRRMFYFNNLKLKNKAVPYVNLKIVFIIVALFFFLITSGFSSLKLQPQHNIQRLRYGISRDWLLYIHLILKWSPFSQSFSPPEW